MSAKHVRKRNKKNTAVKLLLIAAVLFGAVLFSALTVSNSTKSFPNVSIGWINVGNMSEQEITDSLNDNGWTSKTLNKTKVISYADSFCEIDPCLAGVFLNTSDAAAAAVRYGKEGSIFENLGHYIKCMFSKVDLSRSTSVIDIEYLDRCFSSLQNQINNRFSYSSYSIDTDRAELVVTKGYGETLELDRNQFEKNVTAAVADGISEITFYSLKSQPAYPDMDDVRNIVCTGPSEAGFSSDGSHEILEGKPGYQFDEETFRKRWDSVSAGEEVRIPLLTSKPDITSDYLRSMMYRDLLGAMTTKYNNSGENRSSNVRLATSLVNGTEVFPGEEFSFNTTVGKRTEEAGFLLAPAYAGYDDIQEEIGGGICQVSSGIYASALYSFLEITAHTCHVYPPNYMQLGTDATVSIPAGGREIDLRFRNNRNWPVKIIGYCNETVDEKTGKPFKTVTIEIWGTLEENDYMPVEFDNAYADIYDYDRYIEPAYPDREGYRLQFTHDETEFEDDNGKGLRTLTYMRIYDSSGVLVDKRILNREYSFGYGMDTYYYMGSH